MRLADDSAHRGEGGLGNGLTGRDMSEDGVQLRSSSKEAAIERVRLVTPRGTATRSGACQHWVATHRGGRGICTNLLQFQSGTRITPEVR